MRGTRKSSKNIKFTFSEDENELESEEPKKKNNRADSEATDDNFNYEEYMKTEEKETESYEIYIPGNENASALLDQDDDLPLVTSEKNSPLRKGKTGKTKNLKPRKRPAKNRKRKRDSPKSETQPKKKKKPVEIKMKPFAKSPKSKDGQRLTLKVLRKKLKSLDLKSLTDVIVSVHKEGEELSNLVEELLPQPNVKEMIKNLEKSHKKIYRSFPKAKYGTNRDRYAYDRVRPAIVSFVSVVTEDASQLKTRQTLPNILSKLTKKNLCDLIVNVHKSSHESALFVEDLLGQTKSHAILVPITKEQILEYCDALTKFVEQLPEWEWGKEEFCLPTIIKSLKQEADSL